MAKKSFKEFINQNLDSKPTQSNVYAISDDAMLSKSKRLTNGRLVIIDYIFPDPEQPRKNFDETALQELAASIKKHGILQPILVEAQEDGNYKLLAGERRFRASKIAGLNEVPCIILQPSGKEDRFAKQLVENFIREDLSPIEKAYGLIEYKNLLGDTSTWNDVESALAISKTSRKQFIRLLDLPETIQNLIVSNSKRDNHQLITEKHARALLLLNSEDMRTEQLELLNDLLSVDKKLTAEEALKRAREIRDRKFTIPAEKKLTIKYTSQEELIDKLKQIISKLEGTPGVQ